MYNAAKVISDDYHPLCKNVYTIIDTQSFPQHLPNLPPLQDDEEDVSYDVESLFTSIPVLETIDYVIEQNYVHNKIKAICGSLIFKRVTLKLASECKLTFSSNFYRQTDGGAMSRPLPVTFSDIYKVKTSNEVATPLKIKFY